ncbi:MAG TPA: metal-dependent hydrolase [Pyrinomonadaceae bacterium]|nr:metal-dependent hydrolase [Pyrinomonadaceae bacterium]
MDNLTHTLVGLAAAKAGLERLSPGATAVCLVAANAPDADIVAAFGGSWFYLKHHRGITHSIVGVVALAFIIPLLFYAGGRVIARVRRETPRVRFGGLLVASLLLSASHPLMDWTNNYGVRPLLPWSGRWFYGDLVNIIDPWLWLALGGAAFLLTARTHWRTIAWCLLALLATLVLLQLPQRAGMSYPATLPVLWFAGLAVIFVAHRVKLAARWGSSIALAALAFVVLYWGALALLHARATTEAHAFASTLAGSNNETVLRVAAMPTLANPTRWRSVAETDRANYRFETSLLARGDEATQNFSRYEKPAGADAEQVSRAAGDERARIFLDFARFPAVRVESQSCAEELLVRFADLRFTEPGGVRRSGGGFAVDIPVRRAP